MEFKWFLGLVWEEYCPVPVGDDVYLPLPLGHLGGGHHQPLLIDGVEAALGVTRVEDRVVHVVLLPTNEKRVLAQN